MWFRSASDRFFNGFALIREGRHPIAELERHRLHSSAHFKKPGDTIKQKKDFSGEYEALVRRAGEIGSELQIFRSGEP